jgi:hypothetical protein
MKRIFWVSICTLFTGITFTFGQGNPLAVFQNFDQLPATPANEKPGSGGGWLYTSRYTNPDSNNYSNNAGWRNTAGYPSPNQDIHESFSLYSPGYNSDHMGWEVYGFLEIDSNTVIKNHSLRFVVTGGKNADHPDGAGLPLETKEEYLSYLSKSLNPVAQNVVVGCPYMYFMNTSPNGSPFPGAKGANRLSFYLYLPKGVKNGDGGYNNPVSGTFDLGPFNGVGGHWYHTLFTQGGGWAHVLMDGHPLHNNAWSDASMYPYPSNGIRSMDTAYFNSMYRIYFAGTPYSGLDKPKFSMWVDEMEFQNDNEPQNDETIVTPSIMFNDSSRTFEVGFADKYRNNEYCNASYEIRYSFSPITNANWSSAIPCHILQDDRFNIVKNDTGHFEKWWSYYNGIWAPFKLIDSDTDKCKPGTLIHFAIKDKSQKNGDGLDPNNGVTWGAEKGGRDYRNHGDMFDYAGDQPKLKLIKRIDYYFGKSGKVQTYILIVSGGTGSGAYEAGTIVSISANTPPAGKTFDKWTGVTTGIANVNAVSTTITIPSANVTVTAAYKNKLSLNENDNIVFCPNPVIDVINLNLAGTVSIYDLNGVLQIQKESRSDHTQIDVSNLFRGIYIINIKNEKEIKVSRFVKE